MRVLVIVVLMLTAGCLFDTSDTVPFAAADAGNGSDDVPTPDDATNNTENDAEMPDTRPPTDTDAGPPDADRTDAADLREAEPIYPRDELPNGTECPDVPTAGAEHDCNPVTQDCGDGMVCEVTIRGGTTTATECREKGAQETFDIAWGSPCNPASETEHCVVGATCLSGTCRRFCEFAGALGCSTAQSCDEIGSAPGIEPLDDFGVCFDACMP